MDISFGQNPDFFLLSPFIFFLHPFRNLACKKTALAKKVFSFFPFSKEKDELCGH